MSNFGCPECGEPSNDLCSACGLRYAESQEAKIRALELMVARVKDDAKAALKRYGEHQNNDCDGMAHCFCGLKDAIASK